MDQDAQLDRFIRESMSLCAEYNGIFLDNTLTMPGFGSRHLPYKTSLTKVERHVTEERNPDFKGRNLLLVLPDPSYNWFYTPMAYAYSVEKNELTIMVHGWTPAKFTRGAH